MKTVKLFSGLFFFLITFSVFSQVESDFKLPDTWDKDFVITLSYRGSRSGDKTEVRLMFDSCTYLNESRRKGEKLYTYKMKEVDRVAVLKKLIELKVDQIKSERSVYTVKDGWSQSICFGNYCIEGGTSAEMSEHDKNLFLDAYRYLEEFAIKKTR